MQFKQWLESWKSIVSYDFDGVLHSSLVGSSQHPVDREDPYSWEPRMDIIRNLKKDAGNNKIVVVSARNEYEKPVMWEFLDIHGVKEVEEIHCTNNQPKWPVLEQLGAIRHYDDSPSVAIELSGKPIEFIQVRPAKGIDKT